MERLILRNTDLEVSRLCMGGCPMGGYGWGNVSKKELINAVSKSIDSGVNFFDSADIYGLGESEKTLGEAICNRRNEVIIGTKFGVRIVNGRTFYDNSPNWIKTAVEESLKRLNTDYIDLYQVHYRDRETPIADVIESLEKIKERGLIRHFGLSNISQGDFSELENYKGKFVSFQNEYSLACRKHESDIFYLANGLDLTPLTWGSLGQGILTGKYCLTSEFGSDDRRSRESYVNFHGSKLEHNLKIVDKIKQISSEINKPVSTISIRWILDYIPNSVVIAGAKNPEQANLNSEALGWKLDKECIRQLEKVSREEVINEQ